MTAPSDPTSGPSADEATPRASSPPSGRQAAPDQRTETRHRPWAWIAVCAALALAVVGVTIWALNLQSDLDHQRDQTAAAQQQADQASSEVDQLTQDVNNAIDQADQAGAAAKDQLQAALADLKDRLGALAEQTKPGSPQPTATPAAATATAVENATPGGP